MVLPKDSGVSTQIERDWIESDPPLPEDFLPRRRLYGIPALLLLIAAVPSSASIQVSQQVQSVRPSFVEMDWRSGREEDPLETEFYAPFEVGHWAEISPLRIPIKRFFQARIRYWGPLTLLPVNEEVQ